MTLIAGVDLSTTRIDVAILPLDPESPRVPVWRSERLPSSKDRHDRCRHVPQALHSLLVDAEQDVTMVWVEEPFGRFRSADRALLPIFGAVLASVPKWIEATGIGPLEWRRVLSLPAGLKKGDAIQRVEELTRQQVDEHAAESYLIALAGRTLCERASG